MVDAYCHLGQRQAYSADPFDDVRRDLYLRVFVPVGLRRHGNHGASAGVTGGVANSSGA